MLRTLLAVAIIACGAVNTASAATVSSASDYFFPNTISRLKLENFEDAGNELGANPGVLEVGDTLRGILRITGSNLDDNSLPEDRVSDGSFQLTGIFEVEVLEIVGGIIKFAPYAPFAAEFGLAAGAMIALYEGLPTFDPSTKALGEATSTNGSLFAVLGSDGIWGEDYYWAAAGPTNLQTARTTTTLFAASLDLLENYTGLGFKSTLTQSPPFVSGFEDPLSPLFNEHLVWGSIVNPIVLQGNVTGNPNFPGTSQYPLRSQDPVRADTFNIPEPGSVAVWGLMAAGFGLGMYRRRKS